MKRILPILLALLLLAACGDKETPSSQKQPSSGGGLISSQPKEVPGEPTPDLDLDPEPDSEPDPEPAPAPDPEPEPDVYPDPEPSGAENEAPETAADPAEGTSHRFVTALTDIDGAALDGTVEFSLELPDDWTVTGDLIYNDEGRQIAQILPAIAFEGEGVYDILAPRYPDSDPIPVTVGGLSGRCFYEKTPMDDPAFSTVFQNEIVYFLERGNELFCMRFTPAYGVGIGTQRENFQAQITAIR